MLEQDSAPRPQPGRSSFPKRFGGRPAKLAVFGDAEKRVPNSANSGRNFGDLRQTGGLHRPAGGATVQAPMTATSQPPDPLEALLNDPQFSTADRQHLRKVLARVDAETNTARRRRRELKTAARRMLDARKERGEWTQQQMGAFLGVRDKEINRFEHAHTWGQGHLPGLLTRVDWAVKLGKRRDWFVTEVESDKNLEKLTAEEEASL